MKDWPTITEQYLASRADSIASDALCHAHRNGFNDKGPSVRQQHSIPIYVRVWLAIPFLRYTDGCAMSRRRLHLLVETYFQERDYQRFGIEVLLRRGIEVHVWEIFRPFRPEYAEKCVPADRSIYGRLQHLNSRAEVRRAIASFQPQEVVLIPTSQRWETHFIYSELSAKCCRFGTMVSSYFKPDCDRAVRRIGSWPLWRDRIYTRIPHAARGTRHPDFLMLCGGRMLEAVADRFPRSAHLWSHALDYDLIAKVSRDTPDGADHIVFLDEYVPYHPDYGAIGIPAPSSAEEYFPALRRFFDCLEERLCLPIVIAAHPRSHYPEGCGYFGVRTIISGRTAQLVRRAALVLTHCSVANNYSLAFRKPIVGLTNAGLQRSYYGPFIRATAAAFGAPLFNLDEDCDLAGFELPTVNPERYTALSDKFLKRLGSLEVNTWDALADYLLRELRP